MQNLGGILLTMKTEIFAQFDQEQVHMDLPKHSMVDWKIVEVSRWGSRISNTISHDNFCRQVTLARVIYTLNPRITTHNSMFSSSPRPGLAYPATKRGPSHKWVPADERFTSVVRAAKAYFAFAPVGIKRPRKVTTRAVDVDI